MVYAPYKYEILLHLKLLEPVWQHFCLGKQATEPTTGSNLVLPDVERRALAMENSLSLEMSVK